LKDIERDDWRACCKLVFILNPDANLITVHVNRSWRFDAQANLSILNPQHHNPNVRTDGYTFTASSCQD
jgi:hypothetical protein